LCRVVGGRLKLYVDPDDTGLSPHLMLDGFWESDVTMAVMRQLGRIWQREGDLTVLNIGANVGYYALICAKAVNGRGIVHAVEPQQDLCALMARSASVNGCAGALTVHALACSDTRRSETLFAPASGNRGGAGFLGSATSRSLGTVECVRADDLTSVADLVIIDAEGHEAHVWRGMQRILENSSPVVIMEFSPRCYEDPQGFVALIEEAGFVVHGIDCDGNAMPIVEREALLGDQTMLMLSRESLA
jgi:FkbM family methyltransferase